MGEELGEEDASDVAFVTELLQHTDRAASSGVLDVDGIDEVENHTQTLHPDKCPFGQALPHLPLPTGIGEEQE